MNGNSEREELSPNEVAIMEKELTSRGMLNEFKDKNPDLVNNEKIVHKSGELTKKIGEIKAGLDTGHKYEELPIVEKDLGDGKIIKTITTKILEQGQNGSGKRAKNDTVFTKKVYMFDNHWLGDHVTGTDGSESFQFPPKGKQELPNWK